MEQIRILGFAGSLRRASDNRGLVRAASELAPTGIVVEDAGEPTSVVAFRQAIAGAEALLDARVQPRHPRGAQERPRGQRARA